VTDPSPASPPGDGGSPGGGAGGPRAEGDGIAVDIPTRGGLATVVFTSRDIARARPASTAFDYQGRRYAGSVLLTGPRWDASASAGLTLFPAGSAAGRGVTDAIAGLIGADVAAWLREHPEVLDLAGQAHEAARRTRARRDLELLAMEITAAEDNLARLRRRHEQLRAIAGDAAGDGSASPPGEARP